MISWTSGCVTSGLVEVAMAASICTVPISTVHIDCAPGDARRSMAGVTRICDVDHTLVECGW